MIKKIKNINELKNPESFIQVNTVKGFKYIDKAGEIVNTYHEDETKIPVFTMDLKGLVINTPKNNINQLKISADTIWAKFIELPSIDIASQNFLPETIRILSILDVEKVNRIGWRNFFILDVKDKNNLNDYFKKMFNSKKIKLSLIKGKVKIDDSLYLEIIIQPVVKNNSKKTLGILFDVDIYSSQIVNKNKIYDVLNKIQNYLNGNKFLDLLNSTID